MYLCMCVGRREEGGEHEREQEGGKRVGRRGGGKTLAPAPGFDVETEH